MKYFLNIFILSFLFISIGLLSGYKSESSSSGCSNAPEINILNPKQDDNIENPPVSVEFEAKQNTTDFTSIDLSTLSAIISDNMNKTIDISQYIASNCDFLKKNCSFKGEVNLEEGEYILQVRICNTTSACETKEVRFILGPPSKDIRDIINRWVSIITRNDFGRWLSFILTCYDKIDNDGDGYTDYDGAGESLLSDYKCKVVNSIGEFKNYSEETEGFIEAKSGGSIALGNMVLDIMPNVLPEDMTIKIKRIPSEGKSLDKLWFDDVYEIVAYKQNGEEFSGELNEGGIVMTVYLDGLENRPSDMSEVNIGMYDKRYNDYFTNSFIRGENYLITTITEFSAIFSKNVPNKKMRGVKVNKGCFDMSEYVTEPGRCGASDTCGYGSFAYTQCTGTCYYRVDNGSYDCCSACEPKCPKDVCPYVDLDLRDNFYKCSGDEWGGPADVPCERYDEMSKKSNCNDMLNEIMTRIDGKGVADTTYNITDNLKTQMTYENERNEGGKICADFYFSEVVLPQLCEVEYPDWLYSNTCEVEWTRFMEAIQRHEAGHCQIAKEYTEKLINQLRAVKRRVCGRNKTEMEIFGTRELEKIKKNYEQSISMGVTKAQRKYDEDTNHGQKQGIYFDCNKCSK